MSVGSEFHRSDAATGKERRPTVVIQWLQKTTLLSSTLPELRYIITQRAPWPQSQHTVASITIMPCFGELRVGPCTGKQDCEASV